MHPHSMIGQMKKTALTILEKGQFMQFENERDHFPSFREPFTNLLRIKQCTLPSLEFFFQVFNRSMYYIYIYIYIIKI